MSQHTVTFTSSGPQDIVHPDPDHSGCDFVEYLASDWTDAMQYYHGPWAFTWVESESGGYWNGSRL